MSVPRALATVLAAFDDLAPVAPEALPLAETVGFALAEVLRVPRAIPESVVALRPGWAVSSRALVGASPYAPVPLIAPRLLGVGDRLPAGADALLAPDALSADAPEATAEAAPGEGLRRAGADAAAGDTLAEAGGRVTPALAGIAAALGLAHLSVRRPLVRVVGPEGAAATLLAAACRAAGARVEAGGDATGDLTLQVLQTEPAREALARELGAGLVAGRTALRPGGEMLLAGRSERRPEQRPERRPVVGVADRPEAALAAHLALVAPLLARLSGAAAVAVAIASTASPQPLGRKIASRVGLTELVLLRRVGDAWEPLAVGDPTLTALARAEAWLLLPPESEGFPAGATIAPFPLSHPGEGSGATG